MKLDKTVGPELHRIKPLSNYDNETFLRVYRICKPVIKNLVRTIDYHRYNVSKDIISSYFWDKMLYLFNRYYEESGGDIEFLKAHILKGLSTYKYHLLQEAYTERAEYFQNLIPLDVLYEGFIFEDTTETDEDSYKEELLNKVYDYMNQHLSPDAMLVFECLINPPTFFLERTDYGRIRTTNRLIAEFFNLPITKISIQYISSLRHDVEYWQQRATVDLQHK